MAKHAYEQLLDGGEIKRGFLGIGFDELYPTLALSLGLKEGTKGVMVNKIMPDSAAEKAGLELYDVIVELDGDPVVKGNEFQNRVAIMDPGTIIKVVILRDGKRKNFTIKLGKRPSAKELAGGAPSDTVDELGITVENLTNEWAERLGYEGESGVVVTDVESGSEAAQHRIVPSTLIMEVNKQKIKNKREFTDAIKEAKKKGAALLFVKQRDGSTSMELISLSD